jgi:hypothetical protein
MRKVTYVALAVSFSLGVAGCATKYSPYPRATLPETEYQEKIQAAAHWDAIAANEAKLISEKLGTDARVSIDLASIKSPFGVAYEKMLTQHLIENGVKVSDANGFYTLTFHAQLITHQGRDRMRHWGLTPFAGATYAVVAAANNWTPSGLAAIPAVIAVDAAAYYNQGASIPDSEMILTTEVKDQGEIVQSSTRVYYFNPGDMSLYTGAVKKPSNSKTFKVNGCEYGEQC